MKHQKRRSRTFLPVLAGFLALYLILMGISTFLIKEQYMDAFETNYRMIFSQMADNIKASEESNQWMAEGNAEEAAKRYTHMLSSSPLTESDSAWFQCSGALYDQKQKLLAKSQNVLPCAKPLDEPYNSQLHSYYEVYDYYSFDEYLSREDLETLAYYVEKMTANFMKKWMEHTPLGEDGALLSDYRVSVALVKGTSIPAQILIQEMDWKGDHQTDTEEADIGNQGTAMEAGTESILHFSNFIWDHSVTVWTWTNPDINIAEEPQQHFFELEVSPGSAFPYLSYGYQKWQAWQENAFLQDLQLNDEIFSTMNQYCAPESQRLPFLPKTKQAAEVYAYTGEKDLTKFFLVIAVDCHPWLAAMDSMKYFYLIGLACMLVCAGILTFFIRRTNLQREALEESRRDFTNAMAHELKTPLCVIRGFAENLKENTVAEKRDHYLDQIIRKTEEMDTLAAEMIYVSRLDSDKLALQKETVSLNELIEEQLRKLDELILKKKLLVLYQPEGTFHVAGSRQYLEKAVWNLLSNAVSYNPEGGTIQISISQDLCRIENTGEHISANDLPHIFEMFYSGQERSKDDEKHLGLGLYLSKKICAMHHLEITARNTETGVAVVISRSPAKRRFMKIKSFALRSLS